MLNMLHHTLAPNSFLIQTFCVVFLSYFPVQSSNRLDRASNAAPPVGNAVVPGSNPAGCPKSCFCNSLSKIVYCSRKGLPSIPENVPSDTLQMNLNGNTFRTTSLERTNFSKYEELEHLYMSACGVEELEVDTFIDLKQLKWLDLSNNRLKVIRQHTFRGLTLDHLFLNGNRNIQFLIGSFEGLIVEGLYLHDCSIKTLQAEVIESLNGTIRNLWLNGNELESVDKSLSGIFYSFQHLRLGSNPIHCGCDTIWLKEFYDKNVEIFKGASQPSCFSPASLRGKYFNELLLSDFRCEAPVFHNIDIMFNEEEGRLRCSATGDPTPTLFWIQPSGKTTKYDPIEEETSRRTEAVLRLQTGRGSHHDQASLMGMYICVAKNQAGNVTLTTNVTWPHRHHHHHRNFRPIENHQTIDSVASIPEEYINRPNDLSAPGRLLPDRIETNDLMNKPTFNSNHTTPISNILETGRELERMFTVAELVGAVVATHIFTLLLAILILALYYRRRSKHRHRHLLPRAELQGPGTGMPYPVHGGPMNPSEKNNTILASDIIYHSTAKRGYLYQQGPPMTSPRLQMT